jgi:mannose-6-phosphate isomerase-like protein (cupin superfamily)
MVVKVKGEFVWHKHDETDDFFLVLKGKLDIHLRERTVSLARKGRHPLADQPTLLTRPGR